MSDAVLLRVDEPVPSAAGIPPRVSPSGGARNVESINATEERITVQYARIEVSDPSTSDSGIFRPPVGTYRSIEHGW
jgi:hypothetical protein